MGRKLSEDIGVIKLLETTDIGGTTAATGWADMKGFERVFGYAEIGTWNATDDLDTCKLQQATSSTGAGAKDLTTSSSTGDYDTDAPVDADGDYEILEALAEELDVENDFRYVRLYVGEDDNTGVDNVTGFVMTHGAKRARAELAGAAVAGSVVYVRPS